MSLASDKKAPRPGRREPSTLLRRANAMTGRDRQLLLDGALLLAGVLAVVDNALVHWVLGWHRLVEGWSGTLYAEVALSATGLAMIALALVRLQRRSRG